MLQVGGKGLPGHHYEGKQLKIPIHLNSHYIFYHLLKMLFVLTSWLKK